MPRFDHHIHTTRYSSDSLIPPRELAQRAIELGLDGVVITEHDRQWREDELDELRADHPGLVILAGVEVSAFEGHFLVYGLPNLDEVEVGMRLADLIEVARRHQSAIVAAHPYRWGQDFDEIAAHHGTSFDAVELVSNNVLPDCRKQTEALIQKTRFAATGSSDAHAVETIGCYHTEFDDPIHTMADFVRSLRSRRFRPRHHARGKLVSGPVD